MKAILEFNLDEPSDIEKYKLHNQAEDMNFAIWDFKQFLREWKKYKDMNDDEYGMFEKVCNKFHELLDEYNVQDVLS